MSHFTVLVIGDNPEEKLAPYDENIEVAPYKNKDGKETTYNPQSKWDWWQLGGRWMGGLVLKQGKTGQVGEPGAGDNDLINHNGVDQARFGDIDWDKTRPLATYAVITEDGKWHSKGKMGWWAMSSETEEEAAKWDKEYWGRFLAKLPPDTLLSIIDCHI